MALHQSSVALQAELTDHLVFWEFSGPVYSDVQSASLSRPELRTEEKKVPWVAARIPRIESHFAAESPCSLHLSVKTVPAERRKLLVSLCLGIPTDTLHSGTKLGGGSVVFRIY